jgi:hypothetical protein
MPRNVASGASADCRYGDPILSGLLFGPIQECRKDLLKPVLVSRPMIYTVFDMIIQPGGGWCVMLEIALASRAMRFAFKGCTPQIDLQPPSRVVTGSEVNAIAVFPLAGALMRKPSF